MPAQNYQQAAPKKKRTWKFWTCLGCLIPVVLIILTIATLVIIGILNSRDPSGKDPSFKKTPIPQGDKEEVEQEIGGARKFSIEGSYTLTNYGSLGAAPVLAWMAIIQDREPYQRIISQSISPSGYEIVTDEHGNKYAAFEIENLPPGGAVEFKTTYEVETNEVKNYYGNCLGESIASYLAPEVHLESDDAGIKTLAQNTAQGATNDCEKAFALYNYVAENITYVGDLGEGRGALTTLAEKQGDCTDYSDLYVALMRAEGIPARFVEGITYNSDPKNVQDLKHDWTEAYLPSTGWTPVDPTWGKEKYNRAMQFSRADGIHIILTRGRNLEILNNAHYFSSKWWGQGGQADIDLGEYWHVIAAEQAYRDHDWDFDWFALHWLAIEKTEEGLANLRENVSWKDLVEFFDWRPAIKELKGRLFQ